MGDGVIDGRGGAKLLDKDYSWWALAVKAEPGNVPYSEPRLIDAAGADGFPSFPTWQGSGRSRPGASSIGASSLTSRATPRRSVRSRSMDCCPRH